MIAVLVYRPEAVGEPDSESMLEGVEVLALVNENRVTERVVQDWIAKLAIEHPDWQLSIQHAAEPTGGPPMIGWVGHTDECYSHSCPDIGKSYDQHSLSSLMRPGPHGRDRRTTPAEKTS